MGLVIAADRSSSGKTTVTLALLGFLSKKGYKVQSFKVGPDYIDPMFHAAFTGRACRNLDPVLTSEAYVQSCFTRHCQDVDYALIEGVMGLFDGIKDFASTAHIARLLDLPVLLVIDCSRLSGSVAAIAHGYRSFDPRVKIAAVVLNKVGSDRHLQLLQDAIEPLNLPILGVLRRQDNIRIPDRHLGLVPSAEIDSLDDIGHRLADLGKNCFNWEQLEPLLQVKPRYTSSPLISHPERIKIAIASDRAFNFYYQDNLDILEELGAEVVFWSPMIEESLPEGVRGLYFGGGFPEVFAQELSENKLALYAVKTAIQQGMPTYAECGGLMYLCDRLVDFSSQTWQMVGILPTTAVMSQSLILGYRKTTALLDSCLLKAGNTICGHEFHRSALTHSPTDPLLAIKGFYKSDSQLYEGWRFHNLHASYIHLHFGEHRSYLQRFLRNCANFNR